MVEALIALALVSAILLIVVNVYKGSSRAFVQSRIQKEVAQYTQGELQRYSDLARVPTSDGTQLYGYYHIASNGQPQAVYYPQALMGSETTTFSSQRYLLYRTVSISTVNAGAPDEYLSVMVTLRDTQPNARFSPVTMTTQIRKPNPLALDKRQAMDAATLNVQMLDSSLINTPIPAGDNPLVAIGGQSCLNTSPGIYYCTGLTTQNVYTATCTASNYWGQYVNNITLGAGGNTPPNLNPISLQPIYWGGVKVQVQNYNGGSPIPLSGATAAISRSPAPPTLASVCNGCNVSNYSSYSPVSDVNGNALQAIPIPYTGSTTYDGYKVTGVSETGYLADASPLPAAFTVTYNSTVTVGPITLYPIQYATLQVQVNGVPNPVKAYVSVYDQGNYNQTTDSFSGSPIVTGQTDPNGQYTFNNNVPTNTQSNLNATTRNVWVSVQRVLYQRQWQLVTIDQGETTNVTITLSPHTLTMRSSPASPAAVNVGASQRFLERLCYAGHDGTGYGACCGGSCRTYWNNAFSYSASVSCQCGEEDVWWTNFPAGCSGNSYSWVWSVPTYGYLSYYTGAWPPGGGNNGMTIYTGTSVGSDQFSSTSTYNFSCAAGSYGPSVGSQSMTASSTTMVNVSNTGSPTPVLAVSISGAGPNVLPSSTNNYTANASYGSNPLPNDIVYNWNISGPGTLNSATTKTVAMTAGGVSHLGQTVTMNSCVASATLGCSAGCDASNGCSLCSSGCATATKTVTINYNNISISLSPSSAQNWLPNTTNNVTASVGGGSGSFTYSWTFLDPNTSADLGTSVSPTAYLTTPANSLVATVNAETSGTLKLQITVTDTVSGSSQIASLNFTVQPPGSSN